MLSRRIPLACPICGGENFFSPKRKPEHDDYVTCMGCGTETLYGDLQSRADARVKQVREVEKLKQTFVQRRRTKQSLFYMLQDD
jgi:hypothetical protein